MSLAWLIEVPLTRSRFGTGAPVGPLRVRSGMTTKAPPAGRAGVLARMPATRTVSGPIAPSVLSWTGAWPSTVAADGEASTGTVAPSGIGVVGAAFPIWPAGKAGNGVSATTAA